MKLASFLADGRESWGLVEGDRVLDLGAECRDRLSDLKAVFSSGALEQIAARAETASRLDIEEISWLPVIPRPDKILCIGLNYAMHRAETGRGDTAHPTVFTRFWNTQVGHRAPIVRPRVSRQLDYEGEVAVVIGRRGRAIDVGAALDHVVGIAPYNDVSVRDWQYHTTQFTPGKNFPATGAFGPWLVTLDEVTSLDDLRLTTRLNGTIVQDAHVGEMIFPIAELVSYCSTFTELVPGDVLVTGTPGGVGAKRQPPLWLKQGDEVEVEISGIGILSNPVQDETHPG